MSDPLPASRDPRIDPQPGDTVKKHSATREIMRYVVDRQGNNIYYTNSMGRKFCCWITTWRQWAVDAKVVRKP